MPPTVAQRQAENGTLGLECVQGILQQSDAPQEGGLPRHLKPPVPGLGVTEPGRHRIPRHVPARLNKPVGIKP